MITALKYFQPLPGLLAESFQEVATAPLSKGGVAVGLTTAYELWGYHYLGAVSVLLIWAGFFTVNYMTGLLRAIVWGTVTPLKAVKGLRKFFIHLMTIALINYVCFSFSITAGVDTLLIVNLFCFMLTLNEAVSIVDNLEKLGLDVPPQVVWILNRWRNKSVKMMSVACGEVSTEEAAKEFAEWTEAMARMRGDRRGSHFPDTGERRRKIDKIDTGKEHDSGIGKGECDSDSDSRCGSLGLDSRFEGQGAGVGHDPARELPPESGDGRGKSEKGRPGGGGDGPA